MKCMPITINSGASVNAPKNRITTCVLNTDITPSTNTARDV